MKVEVKPVSIVGDTVFFNWEQSADNPYQEVNAFYYRYDGIDLSPFTNAVFYEIFIGLQLKIFAAYGHEVEVVFPEPISPSTVAFWQMFHHAEHVTISPLASSNACSPWKSATPPPRKRTYGVLFGGGKDSTLATCLLRELYGADEIVLFQTVVPLRTTKRMLTRLETRQEALMLKPAREQLGVATHMGWTDFVAQQVKSRGVLKPLIETYTVGLLPAILWWGVEFLTTSLPWSAFPFVRQPDGSLWFRWADARPETFAAQRAHLQETFGVDLTLTNLNLLFTTYSAYRTLLERYPDPFTRVVSCVAAEPDSRWCYQCDKCAEYALFGLANGMVDPRFDYDRLFVHSRFIHRVVELVESGVDLTEYGVIPWERFFASDTNFLVNCHAVAKADPGLIADRLSIEGFSNILMLKAAYGNRQFAYVEQIPAQVIDLLGHETARRAAAIATQHVEMVDRLEGPFLWGNTPVEYDFSVRMQIEHGFGR